MTRYLRTHEAAKVDAEFDQESQTATLHFLAVDGDSYALTVPLPELHRLYRNISAWLDEEPSLFAPRSRK